MRTPTVYIPHGGGPWPFVDMQTPWGDMRLPTLRAYLEGLTEHVDRPKAVLSISAHWEAPVATVQTGDSPPLLFDYYGFPAEAYQLTWPAPGAPELAARIGALLSAAGLTWKADPDRGFDHGTFVPLKLTFPDADVPTLQLSLIQGLDPAAHLALGRALAPLREEGVLIVGSGMSYHNMRGFGASNALAASRAFDGWLQETTLLGQRERDARLTAWSSAPGARACHPREEHLLPLMVVAGAAGADPGSVPFSDTLMGVQISALQFG
ncbi:MAG: dioxygenase [Proteobacteria bacterium]|nr:dioxygenase [Pseudomonadota bacterium]